MLGWHDSIRWRFGGDSDGSALQHGFARAGYRGDQKWDVDASGSGAFCYRDRDGGGVGRLKRTKGDVSPARQGKPRGSVLDPHAGFIFALIEGNPDITLEEIATRLADERGLAVVATAVWKFLDRHDMTHKKRPHTRASKNALM